MKRATQALETSLL